MKHVTKLAETRQLADGIVAYRIVCCDADITGSWHTFHVVRAGTLEKRPLEELQAFLAQAHRHVAAHHHAALQALEHPDATSGTTVEHEL